MAAESYRAVILPTNLIKCRRGGGEGEPKLSSFIAQKMKASVVDLTVQCVLLRLS